MKTRSVVGVSIVRIRSCLLVLGLLLGGCIPDENPIAPYDRGNVTRSVVTIGPDYGTQLYFDLESNAVVKSNPLASWDIAFESNDTSHHIVLNTGKAMAVVNAGNVNFDSTFASSQTEWQYDTPDGNLTTTAVGTWWNGENGSLTSKKDVYVIDLGYDEKAKHQGYRKLTIVSYSNGVYIVKYAGLKGENMRTVEVQKDALTRFTYLSLVSGGVIEVEPTSTTGWDLLFTRYTHIFYMPSTTPYLVTGVLLNATNTVAAIDSIRDFTAINTNHIPEYTFSTNRDGIGYDWKYYDLEQGVYTVDPSINYIIRTSEGFYYKLHFTDFYDQTGEKGSPTFEFQKL